MKGHTLMEMVAGGRGARVLTPGTYTGLVFVSFRPSIDATTISVLKSRHDSQDASPADVLVGHITGGAATGLFTTELITCQQDAFTDITVDAGGQVVIYF